jgi:hypothetical protein
MNKSVFVTNKGIPFVGRFENVEYTFDNGKEVELSLEAAKHILGYGDDNKEPYFVRLGWMKINTDLPRALERMQTVSFSSEPAKKVHLTAPVVERVAAPMPKVEKPESKGVAKVQQLQ